MSKEAIQFTVKGPSLVQRYPENSLGRQKKTGCSIVDIVLQQPCQLGELVFKNYYTAFISIYVKRLCSRGKAGGSSKQSVTNGKSLFMENSLDYEAIALISGSTSSTSSAPKMDIPSNMKEVGETWTSQHFPGVASCTTADSKKPNSSNQNASSSSLASELPWECSVHMKCLMPWPHFELGSQDIVSIPATESLVEWRELVIMRLVVHQPSTVWKRFGIDDIHVFRNLPKRGSVLAEERYRQKDGWFMVLRENTKRMLKGQLVESNLDKEETVTT